MDPATSSFKIVGLCAAPFTPMTPTGSVSYESIAKHVEECVAQGVTTVFVNGTTGEGYTLSLPERKSIVEHWVKLSKNRLKVMAMLACEALPEMLELAEHAFDAGVHAVSIQPSVFFKPEGISAIIGLLDLVASHSRGLPLYYYHIPSKTGVNIRCDLLLDAVAAAQAGGRLRTFRGIKYSDPDLHILANCIHSHGGTFDVAYGKDEQMLGALAMGATGFVGSTYNYSGKASNKVIELFNKGNLKEALTVHREVQKVVNLLYDSSRYGPSGCNVGKAIQDLRLRNSAKGVAAGDEVFAGPPRAPMASVKPEGMEKLKADLEAMDFFAATGAFA